jgi:hypothetical protein
LAATNRSAAGAATRGQTMKLAIVGNGFGTGLAPKWQIA